MVLDIEDSSHLLVSASELKRGAILGWWVRYVGSVAGYKISSFEMQEEYGGKRALKRGIGYGRQPPQFIS